MRSNKPVPISFQLAAPARLFAALVLLTSSTYACAQATSRPCDPDGAREEQAGPACLLSPVPIGHLASMVVRGGPPMLLVVPGPEPRKGFALILHDAAQPPTTLVHDWMPKGLCQAKAGER